MDAGHLLQDFVRGDQFQAAAVLVALDLVLGVAAALYGGTFRFSYLANFLRNDVLSKVVPVFALSAAADVSGGTDIVSSYVDVGTIADAAFAGLCVALAGSILTSLGDLGVPVGPLGRSGVGFRRGGGDTPPPDAA